MVDIDLATIPSVSLKAIFGVHFILITWGIQGHWSPDSYLFYNLIFLVTLLWGIHSSDKVDPIQIALALDAFSIVLDVVTMVLNTPSVYAGEKFSLAMAILNLMLRPVTVLLLARTCADRMDDASPPRFGNLFGGNDASRGPYEDIESVAPSNRLHHNVPVTETADFSPTYQ